MCVALYSESLIWARTILNAECPIKRRGLLWSELRHFKFKLLKAFKIFKFRCSPRCLESKLESLVLSVTDLSQHNELIDANRCEFCRYVLYLPDRFVPEIPIAISYSSLDLWKCFRFFFVSSVANATCILILNLIAEQYSVNILRWCKMVLLSTHCSWMERKITGGSRLISTTAPQFKAQAVFDNCSPLNNVHEVCLQTV